MNVELARFNMIEQQIRPWDVLDPAVLALLASVRREEFVPAARRTMAFVDIQLPLLDPPVAGASMLEPKVEARLLQLVQVQRHEKVLEIGAGSGFMAALLAHRGQQVFTLECRSALAALARDNLARSGLVNATVVDVTAQAGAHGLAAEAPFDVIVLSGSVPVVPRVLLEQLKTGGRLAAIIGEPPVMHATIITRTGTEAWSDSDRFDTVAPPLDGFALQPRFRF